jgi:hypothetical protein
MSSSAPLGCCDPVLGAQANERLGLELDPDVRAHVDRCLACMLERKAFERFIALVVKSEHEL